MSEKPESAVPKSKAKRRKKSDGAIPEPVAAPPGGTTCEMPAVTGNDNGQERGAGSRDPAPLENSEPVLKTENTHEAGESGTAAETQVMDSVPEAAISPEELSRTLEALLFAAEEPITPREMARAAGSDSATVRKVLKTIKATYEQEKRPWELAEVANGYRLVTRPEFYPAIQRLKTQTSQRKLTQAGLETLALIAYRQPIGRAEIESVRGVGAGPVLRHLLEKKLIQISGRGTGYGQPLLYGTTSYFLEHFGLKSTQDLPKPGEFKGA